MSDESQLLDELLDELDQSTEPMFESDIITRIREIPIDEATVLQETKDRFLLEDIAFSFVATLSSENSRWDTYYGPMFEGTNEMGEQIAYPDVNQVSEQQLQYWANRSRSVTNPLLRARYADLVWEFSPPVIGKRASIDYAHMVIDANLQIIQHKLYRYPRVGIQNLKRSLDLALSISDESRVGRVRDAMITLEDQISIDNKPGLWGFCFDFLLEHKKEILTSEQESKLINDLELRLQRISNTEDPADLNPHAAEMAALRLARYYRRHDLSEDMKCVLRVYRNVYVQASDTAEALIGSHWLQEVFQVLLNFGMRPEAETLSDRIRQLGERASEEMHTMEVSVPIPEDEIERYLDSIVTGSLTEALKHMVWGCLPDLESIQDEVNQLHQTAPLYSKLSGSIQHHFGHTQAQIGSTDEDIDGRMVHQMANHLMIVAPLLRRIVERVDEAFHLTSESVLRYLGKSTIFQDFDFQIVKKGLDAYFDEDYIVAIHLLVPQIEASVRKLAILLRAPIHKKSRAGGLLLKNLDELLRDKNVKNTLGDRIVLNLQALFTDQRGLNIRNDVSHGIAQIQMFNWAVADRLLHTLLLLSLITETDNPEKTATRQDS